MDYQQQFEAISSKIHGLSQQWLVYFFIVGLDDYLKCQLHLDRPASYPEAIALAHWYEQNHLAHGFKRLGEQIQRFDAKFQQFGLRLGFQHGNNGVAN